MCRELCDQPDWASCVFCQSSSPEEKLLRVTEEEPNVKTILGYLKHDAELHSKLRSNEALVASKGQYHMSCFKKLREKTIQFEQNNLIAHITHNLRCDVEKGSVLHVSALRQIYDREALKTPFAKDMIALPAEKFKSMVANRMSDVADLIVNEMLIPKEVWVKNSIQTCGQPHVFSDDTSDIDS